MTATRTLQANSVEGIRSDRNFVLNPNVNFNIQNWYSVANFLIARATTNALRGDAHINIVKAAGNQQGLEATSASFTIDRCYTGQVIEISFASELVSGTYSNDVRVIFRNFTNSIDTDLGIINLSTGIIRFYNTTTVSTTPGKNYRLVFKADTTSTAAYTIKIGDVRVSPAQSTIPQGNLTSTELNAALNELQTDIDTRATTAALSGKENSLGNPSVDGYILSSTTGGTRSWIAAGGSNPNDISETSYTKTSGADSALIAEVVTNFRFQESVIRSFDALASIQIDTTSDKWQVVKIIGIQKGSGVWSVNVTDSGDVTGLIFDIVSSGGYGQLVYDIAADASRTAINMKFRAITTSI
jgi:hypothetical protein